MKKIVLSLMCMTMPLLFMATPSKADTLLSNLPTNVEGYNGEVSSTQWRAVTFTTATNSAFSVTSVTLNLVDYLSADATPVLTFHLSDGSAPNPAVYGAMTAPSSTESGYVNFVFTPTSAITLEANTMYWMVIASSSGTFNWARSNPSATPTGTGIFGTQQISDNSGATWSEGSNGPHSFAISGNTVPEPSIAVLLGVSLAAVVIAYKRRKVSA